MPSRLTTDLPLPTSQTGLLATLRAALVSGGVIHATHRDIAAGFTLIAGSIYHFEYDAAPDDYRGSCVFYVGTLGAAAADFSGVAVKASAAIDGTEERILENLNAPVTATGTGARTVAVTVNDGTAALQNARVRLTEGANTHYGDTNASGVVTFNVADATYAVAISKAGYSFAGATLVVDGAEAVAYAMTPVSVTPAADPAQTTAYLTTRDGKGAAKGNVTVYFRLVDPGGSADAYERANFTATSNGAGLLEVALKQASQYAARLGTKGDWVPFTTGAAPTYALPEVLGSYGS